MTKFVESSGLISQVRAGALPWTAIAGVTSAILFGVLLLAGTGLMGSEVLHNAAHDMRHGLGFPCH